MAGSGTAQLFQALRKDILVCNNAALRLLHMFFERDAYRASSGCGIRCVDIAIVDVQ